MRHVCRGQGTNIPGKVEAKRHLATFALCLAEVGQPCDLPFGRLVNSSSALAFGELLLKIFSLCKMFDFLEQTFCKIVNVPNKM